MKTGKGQLVERIVNQQFKIIGVDVSFKTLEEYIEVGKKKIKWYDYYKFKSKEQYEEWKKWALNEINNSEVKENFDMIDMIWGLEYDWKKKGEN